VVLSVALSVALFVALGSACAQTVGAPSKSKRVASVRTANK
jgi:hypothetical protein